MGSLAIPMPISGTPPYAVPMGRVSAGESYNNIVSSAGTTQGPATVSLIKTSGLYTFNRWIDLALDLREYNAVQFSAADITWKASTQTTIDMWTTSSYNALGFIGQRESVRGTTYSFVTNYPETYQYFAAAGPVYTSFVHTSALVSGTTYQFDFGGSGLTYLNSVHNKTYNPGYAFMSMVAKGQAEDVTPDNAPATGGYNSSWSTEQPTFNGTFSSPIKINIGDVWKDVIGVQINQSGSAWKYAQDVNINVGDDWKEVVN